MGEDSVNGDGTEAVGRLDVAWFGSHSPCDPASSLNCGICTSSISSVQSVTSRLSP